jgi:hypothetical protein
LAIFGHGVWTAIVCAAIWRERGDQVFAVTRGVAIAFLIAVCLHGLWDLSIGQGWLPLTIGDATYPGFDLLIVGPLGLLILGFFLREALHQARVGPAALPPLDTALKAYFNAIFARLTGDHTRRPAPAQPSGTPGYPLPHLPTMPPQGGPGASPAGDAPGSRAMATLPQPSPAAPAQRQPIGTAPGVPVRQAAAMPPLEPIAPIAPLGQQGGGQPGQMAPEPPVWPRTPGPDAVAQPVWPMAQRQVPAGGRPAGRAPLATVPYCARCGITYPPGAKRCTNCGSPLTEALAR